MISELEMRQSVKKNARIIFNDGSSREGYIEEFHFAQDEDEEPMILFTPKQAAFQSDIEKIEILE